MGKFEQYGQAAEELFVSGKSLEEIGRILTISRKTLGEWSKKGNWVSKRKTRATSPGEIAGFTLDILRAKAEDLRTLPPAEIDASAIDGIYKLMLLAEKISKETRLLEKAVLVMDRFIDFCRESLSGDALESQFQLINSYLSSLEEKES